MSGDALTESVRKLLWDIGWSQADGQPIADHHADGGARATRDVLYPLGRAFRSIPSPAHERTVRQLALEAVSGATHI